MPRVPRSIVAERKKRAWELAQQGWSETRIALELGVDQSTISRYLTSLAKRTLTQLEDEVIRAKATQLRQLEHIIDEAFQAWQASKTPEQTISKRIVPGDIDEEGNRGESQEVVTTRVRGQSGDSRHLKTALDAMADARKLLGLDKAEPSGMLTMSDVQKIFNELPSGAQTAYLRLVELVIGRSDGVSEEEPERIESRSGQTYFT